jgi:flagellar hook-associated protein 1
MSLTQALNTSLSGLRVTQQGLALVASNVANAETPGFVRKTLTQAMTAPSGGSVGVRVAAINRELDQYVQRQLRVEVSGAAYADLRAQFYDRLQGVFGEPGSDATLETTFNTFTQSLQALAVTPELYSTWTNVLGAAQALAQQLHAMSAGIQNLRADAEAGLADAARLADDALQRLAGINRQLMSASGTDLASAMLLDQRDRTLEQLSELMDIRVLEGANKQVSVFTGNGLQLLGADAARISFDPQGAVSAATRWSADPAQRTVGTLTLTGVTGGRLDLIAQGAIRSGRIAGLVEMRDKILVEAQSQLDALAAAMSQALSDQTVAGTAATAGPQTGFDIDVDGLLAGNAVRVTYTEMLTQAQKTVTLMRVNDPNALPLPDTATADPSDRVVGIDFSGGLASVASQVAAALGGGFDVSNPSGTILRILGGPANLVSVDSVDATKTMTALSGGSSSLPFFLDAASPYSGAVTSQGAQIVGFAGRIAVNGALLADPAKLIVYQTSPPTLAGDPTRPNFIHQQLTGAAITFAPESGVGSAALPFQGSLPAYLRQVISQQGQAAATAGNLSQGQEVVVNALRQRVNDASGVNVDQEMANLLSLQNAYGANARVMSAVKELFDLLLRM